jgi:hypothetical protein
MKKSILVAAVVLVLAAPLAQAVLIGFFPGLDELIQKADAIVILRIERHVTDPGNSRLDATCDCYIYQTLKGDIPANTTVPLDLIDTRSAFVTPFAFHSTHLMFLKKKQTDNEPAKYRTINFRGANVRLTPFGHEQMPQGKTLRDRIQSLLKDTVAYNRKQAEKEQAFLEKMIKGAAEPTDALNE